MIKYNSNQFRAIQLSQYDFPILITSKENIFYFSGFTSEDACLIITKEKCFIVTDFRYELQAKQQCAGFTPFIIKTGQTLFMGVLSVIKDLNEDTLYFEDYDIKYLDYVSLASDIKLLPLHNEFQKIRSVKDQYELSCIKTAANIASEAFTKTLDSINVGITEKEIALDLEYNMKRLGASDVSFKTIVAFSKNSAMPHYETGDSKLNFHDNIVIDMGCIYNGYCSDMTRTIFFGKPNNELSKIYDIVFVAQQLALDAIKPGITCCDLDSVARRHIFNNGYGNNFGHSLGHGVGIAIHEYPRVSQTNSDTLKANQVITIEPGIYVPELGGVRIEDLCYITNKDYINLTNITKQKIIL